MRIDVLSAILLLLAVVSCCKEEENPCDRCEGPEECIDGVCVLPENTFKLGSGTVTGHDLYRAINHDCCVDTLLLNIRPDDRYTIYKSNSDGFALGSGAAVGEIVSENEVNLITSDWLCRDGGSFHAFINAKFHHDHIDTKLYFFDPLVTPRTFVDSCAMTFIK